MSTTKMIKGHELFKSLSFEEVERISSFSGSKYYEQEDTIFRLGDLGSHFFIVISGRVNLVLPSTDAESSMVVGRLQEGDIFGLSPFLGFDRFTTTAVCAKPSTVLAVEVLPFRRVLEDNAMVGLHVMNVVARAYYARYVDTLGRFQNILNDLATY